MTVNINDKVILKATSQGDLWKVTDVDSNNSTYVTVQCLTNRIIKVVPEDQVTKVNEVTAMKILEENQAASEVFMATISKNISTAKLNVSSSDNLLSEIPGTVLHLDSDPNFLKQCLDFYNEKSVIAHGYTMKPSEMPGGILELLNKHKPDILVVTGHDGFIDKSKPYSLESYINSRYYVEAVKQARKFDRDKDSLVIFAGSCESFYDALMFSGANFASSPKRISIQKYDPAIIAAEVALTPILSQVSPVEFIPRVEANFDEIGGIETRGALRKGIPFSMTSPNRGSIFQNWQPSTNYRVTPCWYRGTPCYGICNQCRINNPYRHCYRSIISKMHF